MKVMLQIIIFAAFCCGLGGLTTVAEARESKTAEVVLLTSGQVVLGNRRMNPEDLPARLRSQGFKPGQTMVEVSISSGTTEPQIRRVAGTLATAGYGRVVFVAPRQISVETEGDRSPQGQ